MQQVVLLPHLATDTNDGRTIQYLVEMHTQNSVRFVMDLVNNEDLGNGEASQRWRWALNPAVKDGRSHVNGKPSCQISQLLVYIPGSEAALTYSIYT